MVLLGEARGTTREHMVHAMVGRHVVSESHQAAERSTATPVLEFVEASSGRAFQQVSLEVRSGEVVVLHGKLGSGAASVAQAAYGLRDLTKGKFLLEGEVRHFRGPHEAIKAGVGYLPADRQHEGAFGIRSVAENLCVPSWGRTAIVLGGASLSGGRGTVFGTAAAARYGAGGDGGEGSP